jgi:hypothetical protein
LSLIPEGRLLLLVSRLAPGLASFGFVHSSRDVAPASSSPKVLSVGIGPTPRLPRPHFRIRINETEKKGD